MENPINSLGELVPGALGSVVALPFIKGPWHVRLAMVFGGAALSFYATHPLAIWLDLIKSEGLIGFLVGLFGMAIVAKVYEIINSFEAKAVAIGLKDWILSKLKSKP